MDLDAALPAQLRGEYSMLARAMERLDRNNSSGGGYFYDGGGGENNEEGAITAAAVAGLSAGAYGNNNHGKDVSDNDDDGGSDDDDDNGSDDDGGGGGGGGGVGSPSSRCRRRRRPIGAVLPVVSTTDSTSFSGGQLAAAARKRGGNEANTLTTITAWDGKRFQRGGGGGGGDDDVRGGPAMDAALTRLSLADYDPESANHVTPSSDSGDPSHRINNTDNNSAGGGLWKATRGGATARAMISTSDSSSEIAGRRQAHKAADDFFVCQPATPRNAVTTVTISTSAMANTNSNTNGGISGRAAAAVDLPLSVMDHWLLDNSGMAATGRAHTGSTITAVAPTATATAAVNPRGGHFGGSALGTVLDDTTPAITAGAGGGGTGGYSFYGRLEGSGHRPSPQQQQQSTAVALSPRVPRRVQSSNGSSNALATGTGTGSGSDAGSSKPTTGKSVLHVNLPGGSTRAAAEALRNRNCNNSSSSSAGWTPAPAAATRRGGSSDAFENVTVRIKSSSGNTPAPSGPAARPTPAATTRTGCGIGGVVSTIPAVAVPVQSSTPFIGALLFPGGGGGGGVNGSILSPPSASLAANNYYCYNGRSSTISHGQHQQQPRVVLGKSPQRPSLQRNNNGNDFANRIRQRPSAVAKVTEGVIASAASVEGHLLTPTDASKLFDGSVLGGTTRSAGSVASRTTTTNTVNNSATNASLSRANNNSRTKAASMSVASASYLPPRTVIEGTMRESPLPTPGGERPSAAVAAAAMENIKGGSNSNYVRPRPVSAATPTAATAINRIPPRWRASSAEGATTTTTAAAAAAAVARRVARLTGSNNSDTFDAHLGDYNILGFSSTHVTPPTLALALAPYVPAARCPVTTRVPVPPYPSTTTTAISTRTAPRVIPTTTTSPASSQRPAGSGTIGAQYERMIRPTARPTTATATTTSAHLPSPPPTATVATRRTYNTYSRHANRTGGSISGAVPQPTATKATTTAATTALAPSHPATAAASYTVKRQYGSNSGSNANYNHNSTDTDSNAGATPRGVSSLDLPALYVTNYSAASLGAMAAANAGPFHNSSMRHDHSVNGVSGCGGGVHSSLQLSAATSRTPNDTVAAGCVHGTRAFSHPNTINTAAAAAGVSSNGGHRSGEPLLPPPNPPAVGTYSALRKPTIPAAMTTTSTGGGGGPPTVVVVPERGPFWGRVTPRYDLTGSRRRAQRQRQQQYPNGSSSGGGGGSNGLLDSAGDSAYRASNLASAERQPLNLPKARYNNINDSSNCTRLEQRPPLYAAAPTINCINYGGGGGAHSPSSFTANTTTTGNNDRSGRADAGHRLRSSFSSSAAPTPGAAVARMNESTTPGVSVVTAAGRLPHAATAAAWQTNSSHNTNNTPRRRPPPVHGASATADAFSGTGSTTGAAAAAANMASNTGGGGRSGRYNYSYGISNSANPHTANANANAGSIPEYNDGNGDGNGNRTGRVAAAAAATLTVNALAAHVKLCDTHSEQPGAAGDNSSSKPRDGHRHDHHDSDTDGSDTDDVIDVDVDSVDADGSLLSINTTESELVRESRGEHATAPTSATVPSLDVASMGQYVNSVSRAVAAANNSISNARSAGGNRFLRSHRWR